MIPKLIAARDTGHAGQAKGGLLTHYSELRQVQAAGEALLEQSMATQPWQAGIVIEIKAGRRPSWRIFKICSLIKLKLMAAQ